VQTESLHRRFFWQSLYVWQRLPTVPAIVVVVVAVEVVVVVVLEVVVVVVDDVVVVVDDVEASVVIVCASNVVVVTTLLSSVPGVVFPPMQPQMRANNNPLNISLVTVAYFTNKDINKFFVSPLYSNVFNLFL
jgi:hypothetical protein